MAIKSLKKTTIKMSSRIYNYLKKNRYKITPVAYCVFTRGLTRGAFEFVFILHMTTGGGGGCAAKCVCSQLYCGVDILRPQ